MFTITKEGMSKRLITILENSGKDYDIALIQRAIDFAIKHHEGQFRASGEEYVCHPISVAIILAEIGMDNASIAAALLHDVVEDTDVSLTGLVQEFGNEIASLVDGVTKIDRIKFNSYEEQQAENIRKLLIALGKDARVIIIKLADRVHNMRTISALSERKQLLIAKETLDVYAPIAHRIGMENIKDELEDLSLKTLDPIAYQEIEDFFFSHSGERKVFLDSIQDEIQNALADYNIESTVTGRMKSIASTYRKTYIQGHSLEEVYDVFAVRILVNEITDCYNALGVVHELYKPIPGRFKDYISTPKPNMYQSLHTTVLGDDAIPFEIQIRTWDMHYTAEYGIAAHWKYKAGVSGTDNLDEDLKWVRQFIENQEDATSEDIVQTLKTDLSTNEIFIFTPRGDVINLPAGSTVIDFAYAIHSAVGNRMVGAKVDGRMVSLDTILQTGEIVEIITSPQEDHGPSRDWLNVVKTSEARGKIRNWFKKERRDENVEHGKAEFMRELSRNFIRLEENQLEEFLEEELKRQHCNTLEDFYAAIGYGGVILSRIMPRLKDVYLRFMEAEPQLQVPTTDDQKTPGNTGGVIINGITNCVVKFSQCCNPLPGDPIIGHITKLNGVSIHKRNCPNVPKDLEELSESSRWVSAHWEKSVRSDFKATLYIDAYDREGLIADLMAQLSSMRVTIFAINARTGDDGYASMIVTISVNNVEHLDSVITRLSKIPNVFSVKR